jgi:hypothetical protein
VFETKKAQFASILRASRLDPVVLQSVTKKLDAVLTAKNEQIDDLRYECAKVTKAHNDLVRVYESKLRGFGIPADELHLRDIIADSENGGGVGTTAGSAPADLIVV